MQDALSGIGVIWLVIGVGWLIARLGLVDQSGRRMMIGLAFSVGSPALLFSLVSRAELGSLFSVTLGVTVLAVLATMVVYLVVSQVWFRPSLGDRVIGLMSSAYTNAANFGLPIALALLHDATWVAPVLLVQVGVIMPACLALLDTSRARATGTRLSLWRYGVMPLKNPITVGILAGLVVSLTGLAIPTPLTAAIEMVGGMAVPLMLLSFGVSLRLDPVPGPGAHTAHLWLTVGLKVVLHPFAAWALANAFGLDGPDRYAVVVLAALPTAQNVYVIASNYRQSELSARDAVFWSTILSMGVLIIIAALLG
ncbi:MAG: AEC family transporter [Propioniciclava sp.]